MSNHSPATSRSHPGRSILFAYLGIAIPAFAALLLVPILLRNLGNARFGLLSVLLSVAAFFMNFDFGMGPALSRYTSRLSSRPGNLARVRRLVRAALLVQSGIGIVTAGGLYVIFQFVGRPSGPGAGVGVGEFGAGAALVALATPFALLSGGARSALEGLGRFGLANTLRSVASASTFAAPIAVSFVTPRVDFMMLGLLAGRVLTMVTFWSALQSVMRTKRLALRPRYVIRIARRLLAYGGWVMVGVGAGGLITLGILDRLLVGRLVGASTIVQYSLPSDIIVRCLLAPAAITSVLLPLLAGARATGAPLGLPLRRSTALLMGQMGPLSLILILNAEGILHLLMRGHADAVSVIILQAMAIGLFVHSVAHVPYAALHALGRPNYAASRHLLELPVYAAASYLTIRGGAIWLLGVLWTSWAFADLWLIGRLLGVASPGLSLHGLLSGVRFATWLAILLAATIISRQTGYGFVTIGLSLLAVAYGSHEMVALIRRGGKALALSP